MATPESQSAPESSSPDRWTVWAPRAAAVGCAVPASVCAFLFAAVAAMAGLSESALFLLPIGMTAVAASIGAALAWPAGVPIRIAFRALHGFAGGWFAGMLLLFLPGRSPVVDQAVVLALPLGWGAVVAMTAVLRPTNRTGSSPPTRIPRARRLTRVIIVVAIAFMTFHSYRVHFFQAPHAGKLIRSFVIPGNVVSLALSSNAHFLAVGIAQPEQGVAQILDLATGQVRQLTVDQPVWCAAISPDGRTLVIASGANGVGALQILDMDTLRVIENLTMHDDVLSVRFSPDGRYLAAMTWDKPQDHITVTVRETARWSTQYEVGTESGLRGWVPGSGSETDLIRRDCSLSPDLMAFAADSKSLILLKQGLGPCTQSTLELLELATRKNRTMTIPAGYTECVFCLPDGALLLLNGLAQQRFDPTTGSFQPSAPALTRPKPLSLRRMFGRPGLEDYSPHPASWCLSGDGRFLLIAGARVVPRDGFPTYGNAMLHDTARHTWLGERLYEKVDTCVGRAAISGDGTTMAVGLATSPHGSGEPYRVEVFDIRQETNAAR